MSIPNLELSPNRISTELCQIAVPTIVLLKCNRTDFAQEEQLGLPYWTMILAICILVDVSKYLDILTSEILTMIMLTWVQADTASAACPAHPGNLDMISMTFAAVICDADVPCSVNTTNDPESSFTMYLCIFEIVVPTPNF